MENKESSIYKNALFLVTTVFLVFSLIASYSYIELNKKHTKAIEPPVQICGTMYRNSEPEIYSQGKTIFKMHCAACHMMNHNITGPQMADIFDSIPSEIWFSTFVTNEIELLKKKDAYTLKINTESENEWTHNTSLSPLEIINLKAYIINYQEYVY